MNMQAVNQGQPRSTNVLGLKKKKRFPGSVFLKKTIFFIVLEIDFCCHKLSPLDWIVVIWAIFGLPGALWDPGRPMWGLGGPTETKFTNFHMGLFLALRCHFLDLTIF